MTPAENQEKNTLQRLAERSTELRQQCDSLRENNRTDSLIYKIAMSEWGSVLNKIDKFLKGRD